MDFTKKVINDTVGTSELLFFQLSAKNGIEGKLTSDKKKLIQSKLTGFEDKLINFLTEHKGRILLVSIVTKLLAIIRELKFILQIEKQSVSMLISSLKEKIFLFNKEIAVIQQEKEDNDYILQGQMEKIVNQVLIDDIELLKEKELPILLTKYDAFYKSHKDHNGKELSDSLDRFLEKSIKIIFTDWRKEEADKLQKSLESLLHRFSSQTNGYIKRAITFSADLFNLKVKEIEEDTRLTEKYDFQFSFDEYQIDIDLYTPIVTRLPKFISNRLLYNNFKDRISQVFDQHCGRSRYDFHQRVLHSIDNYRNMLDEILEETVNGIKIAMQKGLSQQEKNIKKEKDISEFVKKQELILSEIEVIIDEMLGNINN